MRNLLNPRWLLLINTAPATITIIAYIGLFRLLRSSLEPESINAWYVLLVVLALVSLSHLGYTLRAILKKQLLGLYYGLGVIILYPSLLYVYFNNINLLLDETLPNWLAAEQLPFYISTSLMPTIFHGIYVLVRALTPDVSKTRAWKSFLPALTIPLFWYLCIQVGVPSWQPLDNRFGEHVLTILLMIATILFLFLILRTVYILLSKTKRDRTVLIQIWTIIIALICPVLGLLLNNGESQWGLGPFGNNVFGDFTNPWYFIIVIVNGLTLIFSWVNHFKIRLVLFAIKSIGLSCILYFFLILLPYLPLSILLIIAYGLGILMLSPTVLLLLQGRSMLQDFDYLKTELKAIYLRAILIIGILTLPLMVVINYSQDRKSLESALEYVFENNTGAPAAIRPYALKRTLKNIQQHKRPGGFFLSDNTPLLTPLYNYIVLDNMTLPRYKTEVLEEVFFGTSTKKNLRNRVVSATNRNNEHVSITHFDTHTTRTTEGYIESTVTLEITNSSDISLSEFVTDFELPEGTYIQNYHLWIDGRKEPGILAEKKAATWLYQQIVSTRRDPGILYYGGGNRVIFRIYPFDAQEVRKTEITFIHKEPTRLNIDDQSIALGQSLELRENKPVLTTSAAYLSPDFKKKLPQVYRKPYYHFVLDYSHRASEQVGWYPKRMEALGRQNPEWLDGARISQVNSHVHTNSYQPYTLKDIPFDRGFFLEKALKSILFDHFMEGSDRFPVIVVLSPDYTSAVFTKNLADFGVCFPDLPYFFSQSPDGNNLKHSLIDDPFDAINAGITVSIEPMPVRQWESPEGNTIYISDNDQPSVVPLWGNGLAPSEAQGNWLKGLKAQGRWLNFRMAAANHQREWLALVKTSFESQIMNPTTAYMALENESQKIMLRRKQEQVLRGRESLELGENVNRMSEPKWLLLLLLLPVTLFIKKLKGQP